MGYWTGFDYKGEPTPYGWPNVNSHFGVIDIAGFPKDNYYYHQSQFFTKDEQPMVHIVPSHWNFEVGEDIDVWAYTNGDVVELFLNGESLGKRYMAFACRHVNWTVPFEAGNLTAVALRYTSDDDSSMPEPIAEDTLLTTGASSKVELSMEWPRTGALERNGVDVA